MQFCQNCFQAKYFDWLQSILRQKVSSLTQFNTFIDIHHCWTNIIRTGRYFSITGRQSTAGYRGTSCARPERSFSFNTNQDGRNPDHERYHREILKVKFNTATRVVWKVEAFNTSGDRGRIDLIHYSHHLFFL